MEKKSHHDGEVNIFYYWDIIKKYRKKILIFVIVSTVIAAIVSLVLPKKYKANAIIMPISSDMGGGMSQLASKFSGVASLAGFKIKGNQTVIAKFKAFLVSKTLAEKVINREHLMSFIFKDKWDAEKGKWKEGEEIPSMEKAIKYLQNRISLLDDKKNSALGADVTINIIGVFSDPIMTAKIVNAYVYELQDFINQNAFTVAKRNKTFIEAQLEENKREFIEAGKEITTFYKNYKISDVEADLDIIVNLKDIRAGSPLDELLPNGEISSYDVNSLLASKDKVGAKIEEATIIKDVPEQVYLNYLMLRQGLLAKVNGLLTTQLEMAKIEEAKENLDFQVIDWAFAPEKRYSPRRTLICLATIVFSTMVGITLAIFLDYIQRLKKMHNAQTN